MYALTLRSLHSSKMYSVKNVLVRLPRKPRLNGEIQSFLAVLLKPQSVLQKLYSSKQDDGFDRYDVHEAPFWDKPSSFKSHRPQHSHSRSHLQNQHRKQFKPRRSSHFDLDEDEEYDFPRSRSSSRDFNDDLWERSSDRFKSQELGSKIKKKDWDMNQLPPIEKNFYVEHSSLTQMSEADIDAYYESHNITISRGERPIPVSDFHQANFPEAVNCQLERNGWTNPTPIQSLGWPLALSGKNMVGIAQTGSGKTLGFILPALVHIKHQRQATKGDGPVVLVLAPTRELAQQIKSVAVIYGRQLGIRSCCIFGGQSKLVQARHISEGPDIVVATPGRLLDFMEMDVINLNRTSYVVLDEADRMLDMGFEPQIRKVLGQIRPDRQMLMWSATWPKEIQKLAHDFLGDFTQVNIGSVELTANPNIQQVVRVCERREKFEMLVNELEKAAASSSPQKTLIFAQTKSQADLITHRLRKLRFRALAIHGDKTQLVRDKTLYSFRKGETEILVATDVASRGLDVNDIKLVINFDYPNSVDDYIHRIGRTGRASKSGTAITFVTAEENANLEELVRVLKDSQQEVPTELSHLAQLQGKFNSKRSSKFNPPRKPYRPSGFNRRSSW